MLIPRHTEWGVCFHECWGAWATLREQYEIMRRDCDSTLRSGDYFNPSFLRCAQDFVERLQKAQDRALALRQEWMDKWEGKDEVPPDYTWKILMNLVKRPTEEERK